MVEKGGKKPESLIKTPKKIKNERDKITRSQAIKLMCIECMGFQQSLVKNCPDPRCPLWCYRKGYGYESTDASIRTKNG